MELWHGIRVPLRKKKPGEIAVVICTGKRGKMSALCVSVPARKIGGKAKQEDNSTEREKKNEKPRLENILHCLQRDRWNSTGGEPLPGQEVPSGARRHVVWCHDLERKNAYNLYYFAAVSKSCAERSFHTAGTSLTGKAGKARIERGEGEGKIRSRKNSFDS